MILDQQAPDPALGVMSYPDAPATAAAAVPPSDVKERIILKAKVRRSRTVGGVIDDVEDGHP